MRFSERDELFDGSPVQITWAMRHSSYASDMREAFPHYPDDEEAAFARRCAGAGFVEATLAMD